MFERIGPEFQSLKGQKKIAVFERIKPELQSLEE